VCEIIQNKTPSVHRAEFGKGMIVRKRSGTPPQLHCCQYGLALEQSLAHPVIDLGEKPLYLKVVNKSSGTILTTFRKNA